ncbi:MAG TPA: hypothetical protein VN643_11685 [Pyrinomonadaceae bacterium]|nr:hypothetical protein [Pyrinomonadaceae bacterium]
MHDANDLLNDVLEDKAESYEKFRDAVDHKRPSPYLGVSERHLAWCSPSVDLEGLRASNASGSELLRAMGLKPIGEDAIEIIYAASLAVPYFKPTALHAGADATFRVTPVESEFGLTIGGLREAIHLPILAASTLKNGARFRLWRME